AFKGLLSLYLLHHPALSAYLCYYSRALASATIPHTHSLRLATYLFLRAVRALLRSDYTLVEHDSVMLSTGFFGQC
ncbi:hypothetical protein, partial [Microcoleus sp. Z1_C3]|uniref:hypothetical protein n=1 Tax=Microcoleus sp. Z1_C3 TaxID=3055431 RepID=UPI002FD0B55A